jgi:hypothetical protein
MMSRVSVKMVEKAALWAHPPRNTETKAEASRNDFIRALEDKKRFAPGRQMLSGKQQFESGRRISLALLPPAGSPWQPCC